MAGVYDKMIGAAQAGPLIPTEVARDVIRAMPAQSAAVTLFRRVPMSTRLLTQPVQASLAEAYWISTESGLKATTDVTWQGVDLHAEELASIAPVDDAALADSQVPLWPEIQAELTRAVGRKLDAAVLAGTNKPADWPDALISAVAKKGTVVSADTPVAQGGPGGDLDQLLAAVEQSGFQPSGFLISLAYKAQMRTARDSTGQKLLDLSTDSYEGLPIAVAPPGVLPPDILAVCGAFDLALLGVREDLTWKLLSEAVITDDKGVVVRNLAQQDAQALRVVARFGYALATPITEPEAGVSKPFPFATLKAAAKRKT